MFHAPIVKWILRRPPKPKVQVQFLVGVSFRSEAAPNNLTFSMNPSDSRITVNPKQCGGRPCIRGMRIRVTDVLDLLATGLTFDAILDEMPDLEREDIVSSINYAAHGVDHPVIAA